MNIFREIIIHEDEELLVVDKPSGMVVNRSQTYRKKTLQDYVADYLGLKEDEKGIGERAGIVHRLDKDTSGVLVVAKKEEAFYELQAQFKARAVEKEYLGLVHGKVASEKGVIDAPLARNPKNRMRFAVVEGGRTALTEFAVIKLYRSEQETFSSVSISPKTGRTHQVRVHFAALSHPVVSDVLYGGQRRSRKDLKWCPRLFLHAHKLSLKHPESKERVTFDSPLPPELEEVLSELRETEWRK